MSIKIFTNEEIMILSENPYVKNVTPKGITYTDEFKSIYINEHISGKFPKDIFKEYGFDIEIIGFWRIHAADKRWRKAFDRYGEYAFFDKRKSNKGRTKTRELSLEEKYERLVAHNQLLQAENELLKKIKQAERMLVKGK